MRIVIVVVMELGLLHVLFPAGTFRLMQDFVKPTLLGIGLLVITSP